MRHALIIIAFLGFAPIAWSSDIGPGANSCAITYQLFADKKIYQARDPVFPKVFAAQGELSKDGKLSLVLRTKDKDGLRSMSLSGREQFDNILKHFGDRVKTIEGKWKLTEDGYTDHLDLFNDYVLAHPSADLKEAASHTWTAKQAARHGFTEVVVVQSDGPRGAYTEVVVHFRKPTGPSN